MALTESTLQLPSTATNTGPLVHELQLAIGGNNVLNQVLTIGDSQSANYAKVTAALELTVGGSGTAGTPSAAVLTIQGASGMTEVLTNQKRAATPSVNAVTSSTTSQSLIAANTNRLGLIITNGSTTNSFVLFGTGTANTTTSYTMKLLPNDTFYLDLPIYTGALQVINDGTPTGSVITTELT